MGYPNRFAHQLATFGASTTNNASESKVQNGVSPAENDDEPGYMYSTAINYSSL